MNSLVLMNEIRQAIRISLHIVALLFYFPT